MRYSVTGTTDVEEKYHVNHIKVSDVIRALPDVTEITTGGAFGVDTIAATVSFAIFGSRVHKRLCAPKGMLYNHRTHVFVDEIIYVEGGYMKRNDALVEHCDILLAFPETPEEQRRSGTWATVRRARKAGKEVHIYPLSSEGSR